MIVRVVRLRIEPGHEPRVLDVIRDLTERFGAIPGLRASMFGRSVGDDASVLLAVTEWDDVESIKAVYGDSWATASLMPGVEDVILETTVEHFEATLEDISVLVEQRARKQT